ncbi:Methicillin resistance regulatory protein MecI [Gimesia panareensis]|uniref:Methicillin resistance regulatory protein MecI n=1 Tax=Gimesia panareensis TaxID=2527978 RepID=A0A518FS45_9PLAN|nr:BlaI/MecI/CopY family transcriptional regulator [Gimesia panareensis]QDV19154.1 Methicillin resistance regulatory protein MecI [Gimesia panareensis]
MGKKQKSEQSATSMTDVEWVIMNVVWEQEPCAAGTVQEALAESHGWAYSTVKTTMDRMVTKGLLTRKVIRNLNLFSSAISPDKAKRGELKRLLRRAFNGALTPMLQFLVEEEELTPDEIQQLRELIKQAGRKSE